MARGLNGETVLDRKDVFVGTVPGEAYGYKRNLRVTVSVRMESLDRQEEYETTDHRKVSRPLDFSITAGVWRPDGRDIVSSTNGVGVRKLLGELVTTARGVDIDMLRAAARWHLNGMKAGCDHQRGFTTVGEPGGCPEGYRYGSKWLLVELPEGFQAKIEAALPA